MDSLSQGGDIMSTMNTEQDTRKKGNKNVGHHAPSA